MMDSKGVFEALKQKAGDYETCVLVFKTKYQTAKDIVGAARARIKSERERDQARADELTVCVNDQNRSETVRRLAAAELEEISKRRYGVTDVESEAFEAASSEAMAAIRDAYTLRNEASEAAKAAAAEVERLRAISAWDNCYSLYRKWLASTRDDFERLGGGST